MKRLLIFLMLFAFGFGAYCVEPYQVTFNPNSNGTYSAREVVLPYGAGVYRVNLVSGVNRGMTFQHGYSGNVWNPILVLNDWGTRFYDSGTSGPSNIDIDFTGKTTFMLVWGWNSTWAQDTFTLSFTPQFTPAVKPTITSATSVSAKAGDSFSYKITATGDTPIYYTVGTVPALPAYLSFNNVDTISGTLPYSSSSYSFTFAVTAANTASNDLKTVTVVVSAAGLPVWDNPINITKNVGDQLSVQVSPQWVSGAPVIDVSVGSGSLPSFLELTSNDVLQGTCTTPGIYNFNLSATNPYGTSNRYIKLTVNGSSPQYIGPVPPVYNMTKGLQFSYDLKASDWSGADSVTISGLPSWASVTNSILSGVCPSSETRNTITGMTMTATNAFGPSNVNGVEFHLDGGNSFYFTSPTTAQATIGQSFTYNATTNQVSGVTYSMTNAPNWLTCSSSGSVTGTVPEGTTGFSFKVTASHYELGSISQTVNSSALNEGESGVAEHVIVDNFSDFGTTQWATDMKGFLADTSQEFAQLNRTASAISNRQEISNTKLESIKIGVDGVNTNLVNINNDMNTGFANIQQSLNIISGFGLDVDGIKSELQNQTNILSDIRDALQDNGNDAPDMSLEYTNEVHSADISVPVFSDFLNNSYSKSAPVLTAPLSILHSSIPDYTFDFNDPALSNGVQYLRLIEIGCVFLFCLYLIFRITRTFEF